MPELPPAIFLGDLFRAKDKLQPSDAEALRRIAELLGLYPEEASRLLEDEITDRMLRRAQSRQGPEDWPIPSSLESERPPERRPYVPRPRYQRSKLSPIEVSAQEWANEIEPLSPAASEESSVPLPLEPLFNPQWTRAILSGSLSTTVYEGPVDVPRVLDRLARMESLSTLPRLPVPTARRGVQVLVDKSQAMEPYLSDLEYLQERVRRVIGQSRVKVLHFVGSPLRGAGAGPRRLWKNYQPPYTGTPVLLLTDLGIGQPLLSDEQASEQEWLHFVALIQKARCPLIAMVPYAPSRYPSAIARALIIICWDRSTTAGKVRSIVGLAHEVEE
jgi:hypothetical protein